jgi:hypothetical protein
MSKKQELKKIWEENGKDLKGKQLLEVCKKLNLDESSGYKYVRQFKRELLSAKISKFKGGGGLNRFRELYDDSVIVPSKIEEGIEKFLVNDRGEPDWMYDNDFREACGIPHNKWRRYADDYKHLQVRKEKTIIWGHPDIINAMRMVIAR